MRADDVLAVRHLHRDDDKVGRDPRVCRPPIHLEGAVCQDVAETATEQYGEREGGSGRW